MPLSDLAIHKLKPTDSPFKVTVERGLICHRAEARALDAWRLAAVFDQSALGNASRLDLGNGAFGDGEDEGAEVVQEFYPTDVKREADARMQATTARSLSDKLEKQCQQA